MPSRTPASTGSASAISGDSQAASGKLGLVTATEVSVTQSGRARRFRRTRRVAKVAGIVIVALAVAVTVASFSYNLATDGPAPRPPHLLFAKT